MVAQLKTDVLLKKTIKLAAFGHLGIWSIIICLFDYGLKWSESFSETQQSIVVFGK